MWDRQNPPLPSSAKEGFKILREDILAADGYPPQRAYDQLREEGYPKGEADEALDRLLQRCYLYAINDYLYIKTSEVELDKEAPTES